MYVNFQKRKYMWIEYGLFIERPAFFNSWKFLIFLVRTRNMVGCSKKLSPIVNFNF